LNVDEVFALSDGNPYFVSELVASAVGSSVPPTVVDAVLGRLRRLPPAHQEIIEQLAVVPSALDRQLVAALERGLLTVRPEQISFRHELTRRAIADALPVARRLELKRVCSPQWKALAVPGGGFKGGGPPLLTPTPAGSCITPLRRAMSTLSCGTHLSPLGTPPPPGLIVRRLPTSHWHWLMRTALPLPSWLTCLRSARWSATQSALPWMLPLRNVGPSHSDVSCRTIKALGSACVGCLGSCGSTGSRQRRSKQPKKRPPYWARSEMKGCSRSR
jgi:hypothetical protein